MCFQWVKEKKKKLILLASITLILLSFLNFFPSNIERFPLLIKFIDKDYLKAMQGINTLKSRKLSLGDIGYTEILNFLKIKTIPQNLQRSTMFNNLELFRTNNGMNLVGISLYENKQSIFWEDLNQLKADLRDSLENKIFKWEFIISIILMILSFVIIPGQ